MVSITDISETGPDRRARLLIVASDDGHVIEPIITPKEVVKLRGYEVGLNFGSITELKDDIYTAEEGFIKKRCLRLLSSRDRSEHELRDRLSKDGYCTGLIDDVVKRYVDVGLIDDARYAESYVRGAHSRRYGARRIVSELKRRGILDDVIDEVMMETSSDQELTRAISLIRTVDIGCAKGRDRALRRLISKGYEYSLARRAVEELLQQRDTDNGDMDTPFHLD